MSKLPIHQVVNDIKAQLAERNELVLQAPPGAGKTTVIPLELMGQSWCKAKILMLEPRRMAARAAAERMAKTLNESVGQTIGYRIRQETRVGPSTKVEIVTGGVLTRLIQQDPSMSDYSLVIFDEFHERNLDADLGLTLVLEARSLFRDDNNPLKLLMMSATLDGEKIAAFLNHSPIVTSSGKSFPVDIIHSTSARASDLITPVLEAVHHALKQHRGDILVFLPGQKEVLNLQSKLSQQVGSNVLIAPLYGNLPLSQQLIAIEPNNAKQSDRLRKVVLSTDIAETSLTIEGVNIVIDSGFRREPVFDNKTGLTRLKTVRISQASATQRAGRAGRLAPGICYRAWSPEQVLQSFNKAEIEHADLAQAVLQLLSFGINIDPITLHTEAKWLTPPPDNTLKQALDLLRSLKAIAVRERSLHLTKHGEKLCEFPAHPRLAHMMVIGTACGLIEEAALLAAAIAEPSRPLELGTNMEEWITELQYTKQKRQNNQGWSSRVKQQAVKFKTDLKDLRVSNTKPTHNSYGYLLALAYPDRIARKRSADSLIYKMSNGRSASVKGVTALSKSEWICAAEVGGSTHSSEDRVFSAIALHPELFDTCLDHEVEIGEIADWSEQLNRFVAEKRWCIGSIVFKREPLQSPSNILKGQAICKLIRGKGLQLLSFNKNCQQWRGRVALLRKNDHCQLPKSEQWPDISDEGLLNTLEQWLTPYLDKVSTLQDLKNLPLEKILSQLLDWGVSQKLDEWAPTHITVASGSRVAIDYTQSPPVLAVKLQEMFGCTQTPKVANQSVSLVIHLLSPAKRPLQVTQDLLGFWSSGYNEVKKEMRGRYPKHPWPDDPMSAPATRFTKKKKTINTR